MTFSASVNTVRCVAGRLPMFLVIVFGVAGHDEDLIGVTVEILVFTDPYEVLQNVVPEQIAEAKADGGCKVPREATSPVAAFPK